MTDKPYKTAGENTVVIPEGIAGADALKVIEVDYGVKKDAVEAKPADKPVDMAAFAAGAQATLDELFA